MGRLKVRPESEGLRRRRGPPGNLAEFKFKLLNLKPPSLGVTTGPGPACDSDSEA